MKFPTLAIILLGQLWIIETRICEDLPVFGPALAITSANGQHIGTVRNCADLKKSFSGLCQKDHGQGQEKCCGTCRDIVESAGKRCFDSLEIVFMLHGEPKVCSEFMALDPCQCKTYKHVCCFSCAFVDTTAHNCNCKDRITPAHPYIVSGTENLTSCHEVVHKYPELCKRFRSSKCCRACQGVSDCHDTRMRKYGYCTQFIPEDKCYCKHLRNDCCQSCSSVTEEELKDCCIDDPKIRLDPPKHLKKKADGFKAARLKCNQLLSVDLQLMLEVCEQNVKNAKERCCRSCHEARLMALNA